ncbi:MAG: hypothetical protein IPM99_18750 [Rubrivivax sp.]|nr:hypothetical protein [Rubrivivax sp.]
MAYSHATLIDAGPALLATRAATAGRIVERLLSAYANGDNLATITGNTIAGPLTLAAGDFTIAAGGSNSRVLTIAGKTHTLTAGVTSPAAPVPYRAIVDTVTSEVLFVGQAASVGGDAPPWAIGGQVAVGAITLTFSQPA